MAAGDVNAPRKAARTLWLPNQKQIHFTDARDDRRKKQLKDFARLDVAVSVSVYVARGLQDKEARPLRRPRFTYGRLAANKPREFLDLVLLPFGWHGPVAVVRNGFHGYG